MKHQILVPLDGSFLAEMALADALRMARSTSCSLVLLRAVPLSATGSLMWAGPPADAGPVNYEHEAEVARAYLDNVANRLQADDIGVQSEVKQGDPATVIVSYVEQHPDVGMIAMSTHGRSGINRLMFGSVAEKVLQASPVPLLLTRITEEAIARGPVEHDFDRIIVPLDGSIFAAQALDHAERLSRTFDATVVLVTVVHEQHESFEAPHRGPHLGLSEPGSRHADEYAKAQKYLEQIALRLRLDGVKVETEIVCGAPAVAILKASSRMQADLIVMATHGRGGLQRLWLGSVAVKVLRSASLPVLLVRAKERVAEKELSAARVGLVPSMSF